MDVPSTHLTACWYPASLSVGVAASACSAFLFFALTRLTSCLLSSAPQDQFGFDPSQSDQMRAQVRGGCCMTATAPEPGPA